MARVLTGVLLFRWQAERCVRPEPILLAASWAGLAPELHRLLANVDARRGMPRPGTNLAWSFSDSGHRVRVFQRLARKSRLQASRRESSGNSESRVPAASSFGPCCFADGCGRSENFLLLAFFITPGVYECQSIPQGCQKVGGGRWHRGCSGGHPSAPEWHEAVRIGGLLPQRCHGEVEAEKAPLHGTSSHALLLLYSSPLVLAPVVRRLCAGSLVTLCPAWSVTPLSGAIVLCGVRRARSLYSKATARMPRISRGVTLTIRARSRTHVFLFCSSRSSGCARCIVATIWLRS